MRLTVNVSAATANLVADFPRNCQQGDQGSSNETQSRSQNFSEIPQSKAQV